MTTHFFTQNDFLSYESDTENLDFLFNPDSIVLAKDPTNLISNFSHLVDQSLTNSNLINSWYLNPTEKQAEIFGQSQTADNALVALFYYLTNNTDYQNIFTKYKDLIPNNFVSNIDSQVANWYSLLNTDKSTTESRSVAYLLYSLAFQEFNDKNTFNRDLAIVCAEQLIDLKSSTSNLIKDNYSTLKCTLENNVIAYFALKLLIPYTDNSDIPDFVDALKTDIQNILGINDNNTSTIITPRSCIFSGLFAQSLGDLTYLNQSLSALQNFYIYDQTRLIGIGINQFSFIDTALASILYFRASKKSFSYGFNSSMIELYLSQQDFTFLSLNESPIETATWFLILNLILQNSFITGQLFK